MPAAAVQLCNDSSAAAATTGASAPATAVTARGAAGVAPLQQELARNEVRGVGERTGRLRSSCKQQQPCAHGGFVRCVA